ncbi:putative tRNA ligase 1 [Helianthus annuus]|nr:putative tRNA ligase 1 [Helianthus annuus]
MIINLLFVYACIFTNLRYTYIFLIGIPGCAKSALCKEILSASEGLEDDRPIHSLMGDLIKGRYWQKVADERRKKPYSIVLADKNAPNEEVWTRQIEDMSRSTKASAVPIVPDSEGTDSNPFSLDALAVFIYRVLNRVNHPGNLDKSSPNVGYVLLMFYHLYDGKNRSEFESELIECCGSLVKMPLLKSESPIPDSVKAVLEEGINLYRLHTNRHGRSEPSKGTYAKDWVLWEKQLREVLFRNADYLASIQVPFEIAVDQVLEQLKRIMKGEYVTPISEKSKFGTIVFAAIDVPVADLHNLLSNISEENNPKVKTFIENNNLQKAHITLAHKRSHGVTAVANYGRFVNQKVPVDVTALLLSNKLAALEAQPGSIEGQKITSKNEWPHLTLWTAQGIPPKEANTLPELVLQGKATRIEFNPPFTITEVLQFH